MSDDIYLIGTDGKLVEMNAAPYDSEVLLQQLLADYPNLLAGAQIDPSSPRRWLLVNREVGVPSQENGADRWSIDHLFLDQDGVPTLVEVKRSTDTRIRREVVGQMLDYAANAVVHWTAEGIRSRFDARCAAQQLNADEEIAAYLGADGDADAFWQAVKTNLQAGKVRLLFVADVVPPELRRIVEFLNKQMDPAEVLALEIKQYVGKDMKTLVPRVIGQTEEALSKKGGTPGETRRWDEVSFFERLTELAGSESADVGHRLLHWANNNKWFTDLWLGTKSDKGNIIPMLDVDGIWFQAFQISPKGHIRIPFSWLKSRSPFDDETKRKELLVRLNEIAGVNLPKEAIGGQPSIRLSLLAPEEKMAQFLNVLDWIVSEIRAASEGTSPPIEATGAGDA